MKNSKFIFALLLIYSSFLISCSQKKNQPEINTYYYEFSNFDSSETSKNLKEKIYKTLSEVDFIITKSEVLKNIPRDTSILLDSLNKFHQIIHRVEIFDEKKKYKTGDVKINVKAILNSEKSPRSLSFLRYEFSENGEWILKYDLHEQKIKTSGFTPEYRYNLLINEIGRVSFK